MKKIYFPLITFFATILLLLFVFYNRYSSDYKQEQVREAISKNIDILYENLSFEKRYAQSLSLMLSKNEQIIKALKSNNQKLALKTLKEFLKELKDSTKIDYIDIQIHTKDLRAFARSWENGDYFGTKLDSFRKGLVKVKQSKKSIASIELGKRLNIKAISPIFTKNRDYIGSLEVISSFKGLKEHLKKFDLAIIGLLEKKYLKTAIDLKNNPKIANYVVVEKSYNQELFNILKNNSNIFKEGKFYYHINNYIIALLPMKNVGIEDIGIIALMMPEISNINVPKRDYVRENREYKFNNNRREVIIK